MRFYPHSFAGSDFAQLEDPDSEITERMKNNITWPNVVTIGRIVLLFVLVLLAYGEGIWPRLLAAALAALVIVGDWLDGHLARRLNQSTDLGSVLDIAADRIIENVLWIILADLDLVPIWIPVVFYNTRHID